MAKKKSPFNIANTPAMAETMEEMELAQQPFAPTPPMPISKRSERTATRNWTLIQARIPNDLYRRFHLFCATNDLKRVDVMSAALREYLDKFDPTK